MTDKNMVCNGHKENKIEKNTQHGLFSLDKLKCEPSRSADIMTIGSVPFPKFDHLYASSIEDSETNSSTMDVARSRLNSCHLNMMEEQAKIIEAQNQEIIKLKKQNESLIARIERMNRRLNLNQCSRRISIKYSNQESEENSCRKKNDQFFDAYETPYRDAEKQLSHARMPNMGEDRNTNFRFRCRPKETGLREEHRKCNKMVRFVEAKRSNASSAADKSVKKNNAQAVDEKLKMDNAVLFLKTSTKNKSADEVVPGNHVADSDSEDITRTKKKRLKFPILTSHEPFHMAAREDINCPVTYTPTALEVPSYRVIEKDNIDLSEVPKDYCEDITVEAAKERHLRFEVAERKRKKWDVQRIRELRQNELLKEKLSRRKSRWNKQDSPKMMSAEGSEPITSLFPDTKNIEKIMITNVVPVTALGTSIAKIPSWGTDFSTPWMNDGTVDASQYEDNEPPPYQHFFHHRANKNKIV